jgi:hypothetical protein
MPKPVTIGGITVVQGDTAIRAMRAGRYLGCLWANRGGSVNFYEFNGKVYASVSGPLRTSMRKLLEGLEVADVITNILACEFPQRENFEPGEIITRDYFVRTDLL